MLSERRFLHTLGWPLAICLLGEFFDLSNDYASGDRMRWMNSAKDIVNTLLWPSAWVVARACGHQSLEDFARRGCRLIWRPVASSRL